MNRNSKAGNAQPKSEVNLNIISDDHAMGASSAAPMVVGGGSHLDWTPEEERKVRLKIDFILLPVLFLAFSLLQIDRTNISSALTSSILTDLNLTSDDINAGTMVFNLGIIIFEIPSNIILQRVGPRVWLSGQVVAWSLVATFQAFITDYKSFMATRFLLGFCESGFIPGALFYMSTWYKQNELSFRISIYFLGQTLSTAFGRLLAAGILNLEGAHGWPGWRWIFLIEGCLTIFVAIIFVLVIPPYVGNGKALIFLGKHSYFSQRECGIIIDRIRLENPKNAVEKVPFTVKSVANSLFRPTLIAHFSVSFLSTAAYNGLSIYTTAMIKTLGYSATNSNLLSSVSAYFCSAINLLLGWLSDRTGHRGPFVFFAVCWDVIAYGCLITIKNLSSKWRKYWALIMANATFSTIHVINLGWMAVHCRNPQDRSIGAAVIVMAANTGSIAGANVFRADDAPVYNRAFHNITYIAAGNTALIALLGFYYIWQRKKIQKANEESNSNGGMEDTKDSL